MATPRKAPLDWIQAAFRALAKDGPDAIRVEPIARSLGTTKGSFYWHFKDLDALRRAMITHWRVEATEAILSQLTPLPAPDRLKALFQIASHTPPEVGGPAVEPALRHWAQTYPPMADALAAIDTQRLRFLEDTLSDLTPQPQQAARLLYAAHLGQQALGMAESTAAQDLETLSSSLQKYSKNKQ